MIGAAVGICGMLIILRGMLLMGTLSLTRYYQVVVFILGINFGAPSVRLAMFLIAFRIKNSTIKGDAIVDYLSSFLALELF